MQSLFKLTARDAEGLRGGLLEGTLFLGLQPRTVVIAAGSGAREKRKKEKEKKRCGDGVWLERRVSLRRSLQPLCQSLSEFSVFFHPFSLPLSLCRQRRHRSHLRFAFFSASFVLLSESYSYIQ